ncbi:dolichyl-phosphate-mannose-protein mannosyltransferase [Maribacter caenipelagi]|uniref:Dolichyl-phosphate-mannose-protein mannosyltransferase n=1 Tax=Maribacter caenipelagi TaxID=1447781 RepID=A0A4R7D1K6_9FLAO|nr:glycosyltransferase family 39 protein [Maribacter caenipelagi]TDS13424.1 dolichyl-phosphate-mannose-protein mannosyltransferase [Maribacter caenipelagi]
MNIKKDFIKTLVFTVLISGIFLFFASKSSPIYPLNDWVDANAIFTVGKSMMDGKVVYKDIFEQKGPTLYLIHGVGSLISHNTFIGIYLMEVIAFAFFLFFGRRIFRLYFNAQLSSLSTILLAFFMVNVTNFVHGDSAEEYCIPLLGASLFYLIRYLKEGNRSLMSFKMLLVNGILAGSVIWIKYSMIGFWFGWMLVVLFTLLIDKKIFRAFQASMVFLFGMVLSGIPWLVYFYSVDGLSDFIEVYFITNIKYYASSNGMLMNLVTIIGKIILVYFRQNPVFGILFIGGLIGFMLTQKVESNKNVKLAIIVPFLFLFLSVYGGGIRLDYYFQIFTPFVFLGILFILKMLPDSLKNIIQNKANYFSIGIVLILCAFMNFNHHNTYMRDYTKDELFQYQFADYINEYSNPTLLNYMFLDMGVYNTANIEPTTFYYMKHNFDYDVYPFDVDALNSYVRNKEIDFVVLRANADKPYANELLEANYTLVMEKNQYYEEEIHRFMLYKLKGLEK